MKDLKAIITKKGYSQSKVSRMADIPQSNFNLICNGKQFPCPAWRKRIAAVLRMSEEELFQVNENKKQNLKEE